MTHLPYDPIDAARRVAEALARKEWFDEDDAAKVIEAELREAIRRTREELADSRKIFDWIDANTTLHNQVDILYVVDGYAVEVLHDGCDSQTPTYNGDTVFAALKAAADAGVIATPRAANRCMVPGDGEA